MAERAVATTKKPETKQKCSNSCKQNVGFNSSGSPADIILQLQRTAGNQAVQRLVKSGVLQAKLKVGQPDDIYEQEADRVADQVMRMPEPMVWRQPEEEKEEEVPIQAKPIAEQITPLVQRQVEEEEEEPIQTKLLDSEVVSQLQRQSEEEEEEKEELLQTKEISGQNAETTTELESRISTIRRGGQPLAESERAFFEPRFGYNFNRVRVHTDAHAIESARAMNAVAFTSGNNVVFGEQQYSPRTEGGKRLLAHELSHVIQQAGMSSSATIKKNKEKMSFSCPSGTFLNNSVPNVQMYGPNVHKDYTKMWAEHIFGRGSPEARIIAREDQGLDEGLTHPAVTSIGSFLSPRLNDRDVLHFPSRSTAIAALNAAIHNNNLADFGRALHRYQDSFSHSFPPPPGTGYNLDHKARHDNNFERSLARSLHAIRAQRRFPNTLYGRGAIIRHVILGHYPDDFKVNPEQNARDVSMERGSIYWIKRFYDNWNFIRRYGASIPPGLRGGSLLFGPRHVGPYIRRR